MFKTYFSVRFRIFLNDLFHEFNLHNKFHQRINFFYSCPHITFSSTRFFSIFFTDRFAITTVNLIVILLMHYVNVTFVTLRLQKLGSWIRYLPLNFMGYTYISIISNNHRTFQTANANCEINAILSNIRIRYYFCCLWDLNGLWINPLFYDV